MHNFWLNRKDKDILEPYAKERRQDLDNKNSDTWWGGRFPPDGAWFASGRRTDPCTVCGNKSVTLLQKETRCLWLCEKHENMFYGML